MGSWEEAESWYSKLVGDKGHSYHQTLIIPNLLPFLPRGSLLDIGCGQGILARHLPPHIDYWGLDASPSLVKEAKRLTQKGRFFISDAEQPFPFEKRDFDCVVFLLSLQNIAHPDTALAHAAAHLKQRGRLILVLNHPCFRIPRQSSWDIDDTKKLQYRRIDRYMSPDAIPIQTHPGKSKSSITYSYHHPLSHFSHMLSSSGCSILLLEEWCSPKASSGAKAKMENRARKEFPLFLTIVAQKE